VRTPCTRIREISPDRFIQTNEGGDGEPFLGGLCEFSQTYQGFVADRAMSGIYASRHLAQASVWIIVEAMVLAPGIFKLLKPDGTTKEQIGRVRIGLD
jgi:hypothetical protein